MAQLKSNFENTCSSCGKEIGFNELSSSFGKAFHTKCLVDECEKTKVNQQGFVGRSLFDHKGNKFNRECVLVTTADLRASDNAHHKYEIAVFPKAPNERISCDDSAAVLRIVLEFQNGGLKEVGANGITDQALLAIVLDRLRSFNAGQFGCRENSIAITKLEEALLWMEKRANDRARRGVEGERKQ